MSLHWFSSVILIVTVFIYFCGGAVIFNKCNRLQRLYRSEDDCTFDPDEELDTPHIIRRHGYPAETHIIQTEDGYLLGVHRIPGSRTGEKGGQAVFLQHGLLSSSADFVFQGNQSLAFLLADLGYDVWLGNARGNTYSKAHAYFPVDSAHFWNFSWHEMGVYDLPAAISYVNDKTERPGEILYVGHSMGTTMFFVFASLKPDIAKNVQFMAALAPVASMNHVRSPIRYLSPFVYKVEWLSKFLGLNEFLPNSKLLRFLAYDCELLNIDKRICENVIFIICGFDKDGFNQDILPLVFSHDPSGTSTKTVLHFAQEIKNRGFFRRYDYGKEGNLIKYGTPYPPRYDLGDVKIPTYLMYGLNDWLVGAADVEKLAKQLPMNTGIYTIPGDNFNHVDFLFGKDAYTLVYEPLIALLQNYTTP